MTSTVPTVVNNRIRAISLLATPPPTINIDRFFFATSIDKAAMSEMPASISMIPNFFMTFPGFVHEGTFVSFGIRLTKFNTVFYDVFSATDNDSGRVII
jgi:hypothetical protein